MILSANTTYVLTLGILLMAATSISLFCVRLTNPLLRGTGLLGAAFTCNTFGALSLLLEDRTDLLGGFVTDLLFLVGSVLLYTAFQDALAVVRRGIPTVALFLVLGEAATALLLIALNRYTLPVRIAVASGFIAVSLLQSCVLLGRKWSRGRRAPLAFSITVIGIYVVWQIDRIINAIGVSLGERFHLMSLAFTFTVSTCFGLGFAFGFFWLTTAQLTRQLTQLASTDPLTRLYNRRVFLEWCDREYDRCLRTDSVFSLLILDLDHFKRINDALGHASGDAALLAVVEQMQNSVRGIDVLGRWGGEEFVALLPRADADAALLVANRIRVRVESMDLPAVLGAPPGAGVDANLTVSVGVATFRGAGDQVADMISRADEALYRAKSTGRNRVLAFA